MVGGTQPQHHQQQQQQHQPPTTTTATATATATSAEEEALKRNTDCVYFLASPLTCKKGAECDYRHSDIARLNPRDCWFWLNGNCLNPKCVFRHPPLDGLLGAQVSTPVASSIPPPQTPATPLTNAPYNSSKQAVPCIFFQKGFCLKGDRCPFLHAPSTANNKVLQGPAATTVSEPPTLKKVFGGLEKCSQEQKVPHVPKSAELISHAKPDAKVETAPPKNGVAIHRLVQPSPSLDSQPARYRPPLATNGNSVNRSNRVQEVHVSEDHGILNNRDVDEFSREPSPGFDVLVDDELRDSDYYHNEDHYGRTRGHDGRNLNPMNDYDTSHSVDYDSTVDVDRDMYHDPRGYEHMQRQYAREQHRASSERMLGGSVDLERRRYPRASSPDQIVESDLRHHLSKQRRVHGLRSVISHDHARDNHAEDQSYKGSSRREAHHSPPYESSAISSRLRGRIKLPGSSSSPVNGSDLRLEREMERGRNRGRLSPGRSQISAHQGRLWDRIKGRVQEDINNEGRSFRGLSTKDIINDNNTGSFGPRRLAELRGGKNAERNEQQMSSQESLFLGKRKYPKLESHLQSESDLSFEGPKPLSEILKRKRGAETAVSGSSLMSCNKEDTSEKEEKESLTSWFKTREGVPSSLSKEQGNFPVLSKKGEPESATADVGAEGGDGLTLRDETKSAGGQSSLQRNASELETEDGMIVDDAIEEHEHENERDGNSDYEQVDGEDYNLDEGEHAEGAEYLDDDDDDGDDFAKKIGVMFS